VRDNENQEYEDRHARDNEGEHDGRHNDERLRALAVVEDLPEVFDLLAGRTDRVANEPFVLPVAGLIVLHVANDRV
jgi:hypothetical protein